ncbi:hypothetical protein [Halococcus salifodinae]|nr:hypothetical protein [Halococcus salifodinae]
MVELVYECVKCENRVRDGEGKHPSSFACSECRGVMRLVDSS